jgi:hypothetical protein
MNRNKQTYRDRFGNEWLVRVESKPGRPRRVLFTCKEFRLAAEEDETQDRADFTSTRLKEFFCDAERILEYRGEKWYVGFRKRTGRGGRAQGVMYTRFRSEDGEVRYAKGMLHFRHMRQSTLCEHLAAAVPSARTPAPAS